MYATDVGLNQGGGDTSLSFFPSGASVKISIRCQGIIDLFPVCTSALKGIHSYEIFSVGEERRDNVGRLSGCIFGVLEGHCPLGSCG